MGLPLSFHNRSGFTLIELVLVMALLSLIVGMTTLTFYHERVSERETASQLVLLLVDARQRAMMGEEGSMFGLQVVDGSMMLLKADPLATSTTTLIEYDVASAAAVSISLPAEILWFLPYSGRVVGDGAITLLDEKTAVPRLITVSYEGAIK